MARTIWILGDQLALAHTALAAADPARDVVLMIEPRRGGGYGRFHKIKLVLLFAAMRHFAERLREGGWTVDYHGLGDGEDIAGAWKTHRARFSSAELWVMEPNNYAEREMVRKTAAGQGMTLREFETCQFLVSRSEFAAFAGNRKRLLMENHYRLARQRLGILISPDGSPEGGAWNFDHDNRRTLTDWKRDGAPRPPARTAFPPDKITREVQREVGTVFEKNPGRVEEFSLPVTREGALEVLRDFVEVRLVRFGDYQDLMLQDSPGMFHSWISGPLNIGLLEPRECLEAAISAWRAGRAPLAAVEGFVRQILGWREFVNGVYWMRMPEYAAVNALEATRPLPDFFQTGETSMNCLRTVIGEVQATAYNHHIQRLMILGNFLLLAGIRPQEALRWFTDLYIDGFDWVMAANVLGMALHADGGFMATKPYAGSAAYISKMSNYCSGCRYDPKKKSGEGCCPFNLLYWDFYDRHAEKFAKNPRTSMMVNAWRKRPEAEREAIRREAAEFLARLS